MSVAQLVEIEQLLRLQPTATAAQIARALKVSQPTVSRLLSAAGDRIVRVGKARAVRYALAQNIARVGHRWPLYRIDSSGRAARIGELTSLHGQAMFFASTNTHSAFLHGEFSSGLFSEIPWFLDDQRPQGFLGRAFGRRVAEEIRAPMDIRQWHRDDALLGLLGHGYDALGDLVLGETALNLARQEMDAPRNVVALDDRKKMFSSLAEAALRGDAPGSSVGGEQPKFVCTLRESTGYRSVIVKFSDRTETPAGRRWADLLICEHLACETLRDNAISAAHSALVYADRRVFLQSTRFDRTPSLGRSGSVSLAAIDAAHYGYGRIEWWRFADELARDGWLSVTDARRLRQTAWFGALIANTDMHLGNAALRLQDARPFELAPTYDMLPMGFRPTSHGEVIAREYSATLPPPEQRDDWIAAEQWACDFWERVANHEKISSEFRILADGAREKIRRASERV